MAFIRAQHIKYSKQGYIISGTAAITISSYVSGEKYHSKQVVRERLGKVIWMAPDKKSGIFNSPTRGLIGYDSVKDEFFEVSDSDSRIAHSSPKVEPARHVVFGDTYVLLEFMKSQGILTLLHDISSSNIFYEKLIAHICHGILKDSSRISCGDYLEKSFLSHLLERRTYSSYNTDTPFFMQMADDHLKVKFFQKLIRLMKDLHPEFGNCCYVDSTPLANNIEDNPLNALCSHGTNSCSIQTRLVLILDECTGIPVWFSVIPGNLLDLSTLAGVREDVEKTLGISINSLVLDAGYASKETLKAFANAEIFGHLLLRVPARKGYPYKTLYHKNKAKMNRGKYAFVRRGHTYFGVKEDVEIFGNHYYAFVYVDQENALTGFRKYLGNHEEEYGSLLNKEKDFMKVKFGYFVLLSNTDNTPEDTLDEYFGRTDIESFFKTSKEYLGLLPLRKWSETTVKGKLLYDMINTVIYLELRKKLKDTKISVSSLIGKMQSLMCLCDSNGNITVEHPTKGAQETMSLLATSTKYNNTIEWYRKRYLFM